MRVIIVHRAPCWLPRSVGSSLGASLKTQELMLTLYPLGILVACSYTTAGLVSFGTTYAPYGQFQWRFPLGVQL
jgi:hypothetical protein